MLAKKSEVFITSLPNFMVFHWRNCKESHCQIFCFLCCYWCQHTRNCKTLGSHLNWTILTSEKIIAVLTIERCRLWFIGQCFNGEGHFKKFTLFATLPIASTYSAFPLTEVSASKLSTILKKIFYEEATWRLPYWNCLDSQAVFIWWMSACLTQNDRKRKTCNWLGILHKVSKSYFSKWLVSSYYLQCYHFGVWSMFDSK